MAIYATDRSLCGEVSLNIQNGLARCVLRCSSFRPSFLLSSRSVTLTPAPERLAVVCLFVSIFRRKSRRADYVYAALEYYTVPLSSKRRVWRSGGRACSATRLHLLRRCDPGEPVPVSWRRPARRLRGVAANSLSYWARLGAVNEARMSNTTDRGPTAARARPGRRFDLSESTVSGALHGTVLVCLPFTAFPQTRRMSVRPSVRHYCRPLNTSPIICRQLRKNVPLRCLVVGDRVGVEWLVS